MVGGTAIGVYLEETAAGSGASKNRNIAPPKPGDRLISFIIAASRLEKIALLYGHNLGLGKQTDALPLIEALG